MNRIRKSSSPAILGFGLTCFWFALASISCERNVAANSGTTQQGISQGISIVWPMSGHDPQRTGLSPFVGPSLVPISPSWVFSTGTPIVGDLTVSAEGNIYFVSDRLYALNPDGTIYVPSVVMSAASSPAIDEQNGYVYVAVNNAAIGGWDIVRYDKQLRNPTVMGHISPPFFGGGITAPIIGTNGTVYTMSGRFPGTVTAVGAAQWSKPICTAEIAGAPAIGRDGSVYVMCPPADGFPGGGLFKLDGQNGNQLAGTGHNRGATEPMIDDQNNIRAGYQAFGGVVFTGSYDKWDSDLNYLGGTFLDYTTSRSTLMPDGSSTVRFGYLQIQRILSFRGATSWDLSLTLPSDFTSLPTADAAGKIFIGSTSSLYCLSSIDGSTIWSFPVSAAVTTQPVISGGGGLLVGTADGKVYSFGTTSSELLPYRAPGYRYFVINHGDIPPTGFEQAVFDDSAWAEGAAGFGQNQATSGCPLDPTVQTIWPVNTELLVRRSVTVPSGTTNLRVMVAVDNDIAGVFFNGTQIQGPLSHDECPNHDDIQIPVPEALVQTGSNVVAYHVSDRGEVSFFDTRIVAECSALNAAIYSDFSSICGLSLVGNAAQAGDRLRLTASLANQKGGAWFNTKQFVESGFETTFQFQITDGVSGGADGFAFVIQNSSLSALGDYGGSLGYGDGSNVSGIPNSIAVEFDTWLNPQVPDGIGDANDNHISVHTRGTLPNGPNEAFSLGATTSIPNMSDGNTHTVKVGYTPGTMSVFFDDLTTPVLIVPIDLASTLSLDVGQAWVGFTAATGDVGENHDILSWTLNSGSPCTLACPDNITVSNDPNQCGAVVNYPAPIASGRCGTVSCSPSSGSFFPVGSTSVGCASTSGSACSFTVTVQATQTPTVQSLVFEAIDSPLDENPNTGGGFRTFPDKQSPTDTLNRRRWTVKATTCPNTLVFFRSFDVDDPSTDNSPIDPNGPSGNDNRGTPQNGTLSSASAQANSNGIAQVEFVVTMHPGDNFRIAASTDQSYLIGISVDGTDLKDAIGRVLPTSQAQETSMLTVWRRLHVEVDSMGRVTNNRVSGIIEKVSLGLLDTRLTVNQSLEKDRFENGKINIDGVGLFNVSGNGNSIVTVPLSAFGLPLKGRTFMLVDDDDFNSDDGEFLDGDEGEDVEPLADTFSRIQDSDDPSKNVYAPAYIRPIYDGGGDIVNNNSDVPFRLNVAQDLLAFDVQAALGRNSANNESDDFWVAYVQVAYQSDLKLDDDGDKVIILGLSNAGVHVTDDVTNAAGVPRGGEASMIFLETARDADKKNNNRNLSSTTLPHEIGHQFGLDGDDQKGTFGIMSWKSPSIMFVPRHVNILRWRVKSPGRP